MLTDKKKKLFITLYHQSSTDINQSSFRACHLGFHWYFFKWVLCNMLSSKRCTHSNLGL